jgi:sigma-E factor negative regulatory protein RseA
MSDNVNGTEATVALRRSLSVLMDGEAAGDPASGSVEQVCSRWGQDADARAAWHAYHLIGDVLRSDELAAAPARDEAFLQALRLKLADEAVPLSPAPLRPLPQLTPASGRAGVRSARWWMAPAAVAAGFVAVAGLLVVTRVFSPDAGGGAVLAKAPAVAGRGGVVLVSDTLASGAVVRNPGLDRYLEAHRSLANGVVAAGGAEHRVQIVFESK